MACFASQIAIAECDGQARDWTQTEHVTELNVVRENANEMSG